MRWQERARPKGSVGRVLLRAAADGREHDQAPTFAIASEVEQALGLDPNMPLDSLRARLALHDEDLAILERLKRVAGINDEVWDTEVDAPIAFTAHGFLLYLAFGEQEGGKP